MGGHGRTAAESGTGAGLRAHRPDGAETGLPPARAGGTDGDV